MIVATSSSPRDVRRASSSSSGTSAPARASSSRPVPVPSRRQTFSAARNGVSREAARTDSSRACVSTKTALAPESPMIQAICWVEDES
jgi:hypothetical protein